MSEVSSQKARLRVPAYSTISLMSQQDCPPLVGKLAAFTWYLEQHTGPPSPEARFQDPGVQVPKGSFWRGRTCIGASCYKAVLVEGPGDRILVFPLRNMSSPNHFVTDSV